MGKLHELLSIEPDRSKKATAILKEAAKTFKDRVNLFEGRFKKLKMFANDDAANTPEEIQAITETVPSKLEYVAVTMIDAYDALLQKEKTNQLAVADLIVDGVTIGTALPATFLLGMESRLREVRDVILTVPTLAPGIEWVLDPDKGENIFRAKNIEKAYKTARKLVPFELAPATKEHKAQVKEIEEVMNVGIYEESKWSAAISPARKSEMLHKTDILIEAVKAARQRANQQETVNATIGRKIFDFILK